MAPLLGWAFVLVAMNGLGHAFFTTSPCVRPQWDLVPSRRFVGRAAVAEVDLPAVVSQESGPSPAITSATCSGGRCRRFLGAAVRLGTAAAAAAAMALPRRRGHDGALRRPLLGLAVAVPAGVQTFATSTVGMMLRLSTVNFCKIYLVMLVLRITVMWFPNVNPYRQPIYSMMQLTDPYLNLFRGWMPPIFGIDLSVILAFVVIQAVIDSLQISPY